MAYYPIFLEMSKRPCLVIGGGAVAERKVEALLNAGAEVTVISPTLTEHLQSRVNEGRIKHVPRAYRGGDLGGYELVFVATDDNEVNRVVAQEGRELRVWVNAADDPANCDFILPSVLHRGDLTVAVGSGGASPAFSRAIREELERYITEDYAVLARIVAEVRRELKESSSVPSAEAWYEALDSELRRLISEGNQEEGKAYLLKRLGAQTCR